MNYIFEKITYIFDPLHHLWEEEKMNLKISLLLVVFFLAGLLCIELKRQGVITGTFAEFVPYSHFSAIQKAFTVVLILEVIIRIALAAPPFFNVLLGIAAAVFAILLTIISNKLFAGKKFQSH